MSTTPDNMHITGLLVQTIQQRAAAGLRKYGVTLDRTDLCEDEWLQHLLEEVCDAGGYILAAQHRARESKTAVLCAISLLETGDTSGALDILKSIYGPQEGEGVVLVRDAGGA